MLKKTEENKPIKARMISTRDTPPKKKPLVEAKIKMA